MEEREVWTVKRLLLLSVMAATLVAAQAAVAAPSRVDVSGTYAITDFGAGPCVASSPFIERCATAGLLTDYSGTLDGASVTDFRQIFNCKKSRTHGHGAETFTGSVEGVGSGTLTWRIHFRSGFDCETFDGPDFVARGVVVSGTGDLAGLSGSIKFDATTYNGVLH
jgi:hypothetical protein